MNAKAAAREAFDAVRTRVLALSHRFHARPELSLAWTAIDAAAPEHRKRLLR